MKKIFGNQTLSAVLFVVASAGFLAVSVLTTYQKDIENPLLPETKPQAAGSGALQFTGPATQSVVAGQTITLPLIVQNGGRNIIGVDVVINFTPGTIQLTDIVGGSGSGYLPAFLPRNNNAFDRTSLISGANFNGWLRFGVVNFNTATNKKTGGIPATITTPVEIAKLTFKGIRPGTTSISITHTSGETTDSNLVADGMLSDQLGTVNKKTIAVVQPTSTPIPTNTPRPTATPTRAPYATPTPCFGSGPYNPDVECPPTPASF